jgi:MFS family permease
MPIYLIVLLCLLNHSCFSGSRMVMSLYALELGANQFTIGVLMALYAICPLLFAIYAGRLADRLGPRGPMIAGTVGMGIAVLLPSLFPGLVTLYVSATADPARLSISFSCRYTAPPAVSVVPKIARAIIRWSAWVFSAAGFIGPFTTGFAIDHLGHLNTFRVLSTFTLIPFLLMWLKPDFLPKAAKPAADAAQHRVLDLWKMPKLRGAFIASGILSAALGLVPVLFSDLRSFDRAICFRYRLQCSPPSRWRPSPCAWCCRHGRSARAKPRYLSTDFSYPRARLCYSRFFANPWLLGMVAFILDWA